MKTFETMKHNIPEGATHYRDESDDFRFSWVMFDDGGALKVYTTALGWCRFNRSKFEDKVKPIPKIPTETPEEKGALDAIEKTYRYEKVTDSIFDLKEEFERGELYFAWLGNNEPGSNSVGYDQITDEKMLLCRYEEKRLLRRIEVTGRELFIELVERVGSELMDNGEWSFACLATSILDSEEFNITKGKG